MHAQYVKTYLTYIEYSYSDNFGNRTSWLSCHGESAEVMLTVGFLANMVKLM